MESDPCGTLSVVLAIIQMQRQLGELPLPVNGVVEGAKFTCVTGGPYSAESVRSRETQNDRFPNRPSVAWKGDVDAPACRATGEGKYICEDVRRGVVEMEIPGFCGLGHVGQDFRPRGELLDISMNADSLGLGSSGLDQSRARRRQYKSGRSKAGGCRAQIVLGSTSGVVERMLY